MFLDLAKSIALRSRNNARLRYWGRVLALVFVVIGGLDIVSTNAALAAGHFEGNPLVRSLQADMGTWWSLPKMAFHLLLAYLILWIPSKRMLAIGSLVILFSNAVRSARVAGAFARGDIDMKRSRVPSF